MRKTYQLTSGLGLAPGAEPSAKALLTPSSLLLRSTLLLTWNFADLPSWSLVQTAADHQRLCRSDYRQGGSIIQIGLGLSLHCPLLFLVWARLLLWKPYQGFQVTLRLISLVWKVWRFFEGLKYWNRFEDFFPIQRRGSCMSLQKKVTWECFLFILKPLLEGGQILSNWVGEHLSSTLSVSARRPTVLHTGCWKFPQVCSGHHRKLLFISSNY